MWGFGWGALKQHPWLNEVREFLGGYEHLEFFKSFSVTIEQMPSTECFSMWTKYIMLKTIWYIRHTKSFISFKRPPKHLLTRLLYICLCVILYCSKSRQTFLICTNLNAIYIHEFFSICSCFLWYIHKVYKSDIVLWLEP